MTSRPDAAYVWAWLPVATDPVPAGKLERHKGADIIDGQLHVIPTQWDEAADTVTLTRPERAQFRGRQILNPFATYGYDEG